MKNILYAIFAIVGLYKVVFSFINPEKATTLFSLEMNVWIYRVLWSLVIFGMIQHFVQNFKKEAKK